jgi:hypothetical protein
VLFLRAAVYRSLQSGCSCQMLSGLLCMRPCRYDGDCVQL